MLPRRPPTLAAALLAALALTVSCSTSPAPQLERIHEVPVAIRQTPAERQRSEAFGHGYMISTEGTAATAAAKSILDQGGNIIDAAVAASFAISVERPQSTGLGGGGFLLYREAKTGKIYAIDFRERAPLRANQSLFVDRQGGVVPGRSVNGILSVAVPGLVAGLTEIHRRFGRLPLARLVAPAISLANNGFPVYPSLARALFERRSVLAEYPATRAIFLKPDGTPWRAGETLRQKDLAGSLRLIAREEAHAFYEGRIARAILRQSRRLHGILGADDLRGYQVRWREPVRGHFHGMEVVSMPPPSSGGALVIEILQMLDHDPLPELGPLTAPSIHLEASAMQLAFADRAAYFGDPDFVKVPLAALLSPAYAARQRARIQPDRATPSSDVGPGKLLPDGAGEKADTTHFSIMDDEGNAVSSTQTINGWMGSGIVVPGTGIVLNDEMDDFSVKQGASNQFGAVSTSNANSIAPGKTPLSSMAPTLVLESGKPRLVVGAPGGTEIITCVAQTILNYLGYGLTLYDSLDAVRFHDQWKPDELLVEAPGPAPSVLNRLANMGYSIRLEPNGLTCRVMAVAREAEGLHGVSDPRDAGSAAGG